MAKHLFMPLHCPGPPHHSQAWCVSEVWISRPFLDVTQEKEPPDDKQIDSLGTEEYTQFRTKICATAKHAHTATPFFASRYREIGRIKVQIKHSHKIRYSNSV